MTFIDFHKLRCKKPQITPITSIIRKNSIGKLVVSFSFLLAPSSKKQEGFLPPNGHKLLTPECNPPRQSQPVIPPPSRPTSTTRLDLETSRRTTSTSLLELAALGLDLGFLQECVSNNSAHKPTSERHGGGNGEEEDVPCGCGDRSRSA